MHPLTSISLNNLGELYSAQERYDEAEPLLRRALHIREVSLGSANTDVATVSSFQPSGSISRSMCSGVFYM